VRIDISSVDCSQPGLDQHVEESEAGRLVSGPAEDVPAEDERRDEKRRRTETTLLHRKLR
jgi:hypothetical protein